MAGGHEAALDGRRGAHGEPRVDVAGMLADLWRTLTARYGTADEDALDGVLDRPGGPDGARTATGQATRAATRTAPRGTVTRTAPRIVVPVWFHVVTDGAEGRVPRAVARRQVATLNRAYGGERGGVDTGVRFRLAGYDSTSSGRWFRAPDRYEREMKRALRKGGRRTLNLYTANVGSDVLGFSTFPQWYAEDPAGDGVVVDHRTLPGGSFKGFDRGHTAAHEVGHWLGLFHTFENGCRAPGDGVDDTPYEARPAEGCPRSRNTCDRPGKDPVRNFMNYAADGCMREFTRGQARRIRASWAAYRASEGGPDRGAAARSVGGGR
ncbi:zinc metalloprotease [Spirillospora sp. NPDC029432]|uniref:zinc metalloprotease n=1 Tax=Spirillospora sp. NPDC029432 TaxID=3154599 RepID=UPI003456ECF8